MPLFENIFGTTPIEDVSALIPTHISSRSELNEWEAANILEASRKYLARKKTTAIDMNFIKNVHKEMFNKTWKWAGAFRTRNFNIGVDWHMIREQLKLLLDDIDFWERGTSGLSVFQQAVRIHHRLVKIHPFINGNGRHARMVSDIFLYYHGYKMPIWPDQKLVNETNIRKKYINALKSADNGDYHLLESFIHKLV